MVKLFNIKIVGICMANGLAKIGVCPFTSWVTLGGILKVMCVSVFGSEVVRQMQCMVCSMTSSIDGIAEGGKADEMLRGSSVE